MMTRRVFLKNGSLALVSLGFTPAFIARSAQAAETRKKFGHLIEGWGKSV